MLWRRHALRAGAGETTDYTTGAPPRAAAHLQVFLLMLGCQRAGVVLAAASSFKACNLGKPQAYQFWAKHE